jgi:hypothetical protein
MDLPDYVQSVSFRIARPNDPGSQAIRLTTFLLRRFGLRLDVLNTCLPCENGQTRRRLRGARRTCPAGTLAVGAIINRAVAQLATDEAFLALGVGDGFPLWAAMSGNPDKMCIGVDPLLDLQKAGKDRLRATMNDRFERARSSNHHLHARDFSSYFASLQDMSIGFCFIGGGSHENPLERLRGSEPRLAENAFILVENSNSPRVRDAGLGFIQSSRNQYRILLDRRTPYHGGLTFGNGVLLFQLLGRNAAADRRTREPAAPVLVPAA